MVIIVALGLNIREGLFFGGGGGFKLSFNIYIYLNGYSEFDSKISYLMFLHDYLLACEISTVRTQTLNGLYHRRVFAVCLHIDPEIYEWVFVSEISWPEMKSKAGNDSRRV